MKKLLMRLIFVTLGTVIIIAAANGVRDGNVLRYSYDDINWGSYRHEVPYDKSEWNIVFDQHSHTISSDGVLSAEKNIEWHLAMGFNGMVISDHNNFGSVDEAATAVMERYSDRILFIPGYEWTTNRVHLNFLFPPGMSGKELSRAIENPPVFPDDDEIRSVIERVHSLGGLVTVNHIPWTDRTNPDTQPSREQFLQWGVDFIEIVNEAEWDGESFDFIEGTTIRGITGTDMHSPKEAYGWTLLKSAEFTAESLFKSLKEGQSRVVYLPEGSPYPFEHEGKQTLAYTLLKPVIALGDYFTELTWPVIRTGEIFILLGWIFAVFILAEFFRAIFGALNRKISTKGTERERT